MARPPVARPRDPATLNGTALGNDPAVLNLLAILLYLFALAAVVLLVRRTLAAGGTPAAAGEMACVACGAPAAALVTFTCPSCGHDVRDAGLASPGGRSPTRPLWVLLAWTTVLGGAAALVTGLLGERLARYHVEYEIDRQSWRETADGTAYAISVHGGGSPVDPGDGGGPLRGDLVADLWVKGGGFASLEVDAPPLRGRVVDAGGAAVAADAPLDLPLVLRWFAAAGADPDAAEVDRGARDALRAIAADLRHPIDVPPSQKPLGGGMSNSGMSGGGSSSGRHSPPGWFPPAALLFWTAVWVGGAWHWLSRWSNRSGSPAAQAGNDDPPAEPAAAGGRTG